MNGDILVDIAELLEIAATGSQNIENIKLEVAKLKLTVAEIEGMESPSYLEQLCEELSDYASDVDTELLDSIADFYNKIGDVATVSEEADTEMMKGV